MTTIRFAVPAVLIAIVISFAGFTSAQTYTPEEQELRAKLFAIIADLQQQIATLIALKTTTSYTFTDTDKASKGSEGEHVRQLQKALNKLGYTIASTGDGSPGQETTYFGPATENALKRFQAAQGIVSSGNPASTGYGALGPSTRAKLNALLATTPSSTTKPTTTTSPTSTSDEEEDTTTSGGGGGGSTSVSGTAQNPTATLSVTDSSITNGDSTTLSWSSNNADTCTGTNFNTSDNTSGSLSISPTATTTYTLSCTGEGGTDTDTLTVTVNATPATCTSFTYSAWGACQPNSTQSRTVQTSSPTSCTGGSPVLTQSCTYTPPPQPSGGAPYDLGAVPFSYSWPTPPTTNTTINVTANSFAELQSAVSQSNVRVVVPAGTYVGNLNVTGSDLDVVLSESATIQGILTWGDYAAPVRTARIRWTGGNLEGGMRAQPINDLLVDNFYVDSDANISPEGINNMSGVSGIQPSGWNRMAWINSTIKLRNGTGGWAWYQAGEGHDMIMANVKMISEGSQNNRFIGITNLIIVDSVFNPDGLSTNGMRIHNSTTNVFMRDSWMRSFFKMDEVNEADTGPQVLNATFLRVDRYEENAWGTFAFFGDAPNTGTVTDSTIYSQNEPTTGTPFLGTLTGSGNTMQPWDGVTVPNASSYGAQR